MENEPKMLQDTLLVMNFAAKVYWNQGKVLPWKGAGSSTVNEWPKVNKYILSSLHYELGKVFWLKGNQTLWHFDKS